MIRDATTGEWIQGCPYKAVPRETFEILAYHSDWENGHTPVSTGRAPWLPAAFVQGMHAVKAAIGEEQAARAEQERLKHQRVTVGGAHGRY